jgi:hypothetical protein
MKSSSVKNQELTSINSTLEFAYVKGKVMKKLISLAVMTLVASMVLFYPQRGGAQTSDELFIDPSLLTPSESQTGWWCIGEEAEAVVAVPLRTMVLPHNPGYITFTEADGTISDYLVTITGADLQFYSDPCAPTLDPWVPLLGSLRETGELQPVGHYFGVENDFIKVKSDLDVPEPSTFALLVGAVFLACRHRPDRR